MIPAKVTIGTHEYVVSLAEVIRRPVQSLRQAVDQGTERGEQSLDNAALWKRTQSDFVLGQGQSYFDQEDEADRRRMRAVQNFDPLSNRRALATSNDWVVAVGAITAAGNYHRLIRTASNFWWGSGSQLHRSTSFTNFSTTSITGGPGVAEFRDMAVFGTTMYVAYSSGVYSGSITGSSVSSFSTEDATVINADLGRLLIGNGPDLKELSSTGTGISVFTHPNPQWNWVAFAAGNAGVYVAGTDGLRSEIYLITVLDATGAFAPPMPVAQLPHGELIRRMAYFGGFLVICTSSGVRIAQAAQSGLLNYGPIIALGDIAGVTFEGRFAYVVCSSIPTFAKPGVVALSLERFTAPLTPAYAAVAVYDEASSAYTGRDVAISEGRVFGLLSTGGSNYIFWPAAGYTNLARYWSGAITYGTPEPKVVTSVEVTFDALTSGTSVTCSIYDRQGGTLYGTGTASTVGQTSLSVTTTSELRAESFEIYIEAVGSSGPVTIRRWTARAVVAPTHVTEEIILPLMLSREVLADDGSYMLVDPLDEWNYLVDLQRTRSQVPLIFGSQTSQVWVDQVGVENGWHRWPTSDEWPEGTVLIRLLTVGAADE